MIRTSSGGSLNTLSYCYEEKCQGAKAPFRRFNSLNRIKINAENNKLAYAAQLRGRQPSGSDTLEFDVKYRATF